MPAQRFHRFILLLLWPGLAAMVSAQSVRVVARIGPGAVTYAAPAGATLDATPGVLVPEKSRITTAGDVELYLEVLPGIIAVVRPHTQLVPERIVSGAGGGGASGPRQALLDVQQGEVVVMAFAGGGGSTLFAVRSPDGALAKARSAVFAVKVDGNNRMVVAAAGEVELTARASAPVTLRGGQLPGSHFVEAGGQRRENLDPAWQAQLRELAGAALAANSQVAGDPRLFEAGLAKAAADFLPACLGVFLQAATAASVPARDEIGTTLERAAGRLQGQWILMAGMTLKAMPPAALESCIDTVAESLARGGVAAEPAAGGEATGTLLTAFQVADPQRFSQLRQRLAIHVTLGNVVGQIRRKAAQEGPRAAADAAPGIAADSMKKILITLPGMDPNIRLDAEFLSKLRSSLGQAVAKVLDAVFRQSPGTSTRLDDRLLERIVAALMNVGTQVDFSVPVMASKSDSMGNAISTVTPIDPSLNVSPSH